MVGERLDDRRAMRYDDSGGVSVWCEVVRSGARLREVVLRGVEWREVLGGGVRWREVA